MSIIGFHPFFVLQLFTSWTFNPSFLTPFHDSFTRSKFDIMWVPKSPLYRAQKINCWFHLIGDDLNWEKLPIVSLSVWIHLISFFMKNNGFRAKVCWTLKIDLFIRYNFCRKYLFPRSIFIDITWKNLLKTFFLCFDLENKICGYFYHHIRNQRLKIREYSKFQINRR